MAAPSCVEPRTAWRRWHVRRLDPVMSMPLRLEDVSFYADLVKTLASRAAIDPPSNLDHSRIYIFTAGSDSVMSPETVEKGRDVYVALGVPAANIVLEDRNGPAAKVEKLRRQMLCQQGAVHQRLPLRPSGCGAHGDLCTRPQAARRGARGSDRRFRPD